MKKGESSNRYAGRPINFKIAALAHQKILSIRQVKANVCILYNFKYHIKSLHSNISKKNFEISVEANVFYFDRMFGYIKEQSLHTFHIYSRKVAIINVVS